LEGRIRWLMHYHVMMKKALRYIPFPYLHLIYLISFIWKQRLCLKSSTSVKLLKLVQRGQDGLY
jgi:hypothetical protein